MRRGAWTLSTPMRRPGRSGSPAPFSVSTLPIITSGQFRSTYTSPSVQPTGGRRDGRYRGDQGGDVRTSLRKAAGQVFEPDRPHKSFHVLGRRPETKTLVTPVDSASVGHAFKIGGRAKARRRVRFRPPPLPKGASSSGVRAPGERRPRGRHPIRARTTASTTQVFGVSFARRRTSLPTDRRRTGQVFGRRPFEGEVGAAWSAVLDDRWRDLPFCWFLRPTPRPSCRRRARTRTCAPRAPRH
jgi:hypothetical protein